MTIALVLLGVTHTAVGALRCKCYHAMTRPALATKRSYYHHRHCFSIWDQAGPGKCSSSSQLPAPSVLWSTGRGIFCVSNDRRNYDDSVAFCNSIGYTIASVHNQAENSIVRRRPAAPTTFCVLRRCAPTVCSPLLAACEHRERFGMRAHSRPTMLLQSALHPR